LIQNNQSYSLGLRDAEKCRHRIVSVFFQEVVVLSNQPGIHEALQFPDDLTLLGRNDGAMCIDVENKGWFVKHGYYNDKDSIIRPALSVTALSGVQRVCLSPTRRWVDRYCACRINPATIA